MLPAAIVLASIAYSLVRKALSFASRKRKFFARKERRRRRIRRRGGLRIDGEGDESDSGYFDEDVDDDNDDDNDDNSDDDGKRETITLLD